MWKNNKFFILITIILFCAILIGGLIFSFKANDLKRFDIEKHLLWKLKLNNFFYGDTFLGLSNGMLKDSLFLNSNSPIVYSDSEYLYILLPKTVSDGFKDILTGEVYFYIVSLKDGGSKKILIKKNVAVNFDELKNELFQKRIFILESKKRMEDGTVSSCKILNIINTAESEPFLKTYIKNENLGCILSALKVNDRIFLNTSNGFFISIDAKSGEIIYTKRYGKVSNGIIREFEKDKLLLFERTENNFYVINSQNGEIMSLFKGPVFKKGQTYLTTDFCYYEKTKLFYFLKGGPQEEYEIECVDLKVTPESKNILFKLKGGSDFLPIPTFYNNFFYYFDFDDLIIRDSEIYKADAATGKIKWKTNLKESVLYPPILANNKLWVLSSIPGNLYVLNEKTGEIISDFKLGSYSLFTPLYFDNKIYITCHDGTIYCFKP